ncbi:hypothetical protein EU520_01370 [Candidatus Thorarchaeota archaeon]|nr:MAG: hypothetical protein EU520_01370 [Candidatus Thorarchaeota archaeon]
MRDYRVIFIFVSLIVIVVSLASMAYGWLLTQGIYQEMYAFKGDVDYWGIWTLQNNLFTASIILTILSLLTLPQRSSFLKLVSSISETDSVVWRLSLGQAVLWRLFQFILFFGFYVSIGGYSLTGQNVAFLMMLVGDGSISISSEQLAELFSLPFRPDVSAQSVVELVPAMEAYQLYLGFLSTILLFTAIRIGMSIASDLLAKRRDTYSIGAKVLFIASLGLTIQLLGAPMWTVNAGTWMTYLALIIALVSSLIGAALLLIVRIRSGGALARLKSKITQLEEDMTRLQNELMTLREEYESGALEMEDYKHRVNLLMQDRAHISSELRRLKLQKMLPFSGSPRKYGLLAVFLIVIVVLLPVIQALYYGIQMGGDKYIPWKFNYETRKEITITNWAAGVEDLEGLTLEDLTSNATPQSEVEFLTTVRQWDQDASYLRMKNQIGTNWMELADSDIVYLGGHEYWIAPLTFDYRAITTSFINQHLIYTHTEGMVILDAYSGDIVEGDERVALLNRTETAAIYYGEGVGFQDVVFVNVEEFDEVGNLTLGGVPDYTLSGFEFFYYILSMGPEAWSFLGRDMDMLLERNVQSRVQSILLQGLTTDSDPYIVVGPTGEIYYAVSVFIDYRLATGYAHENYVRFLGVVLVGIDDGELSFYRAPDQNSSFFIDKTYNSYYPWQEPPDWLQSQMKWPEDLYERQLDVAYTYHVEDGYLWASGVDFHESPEGSDTRYIIMRIGGEERFVAMHNAEFEDSVGRNLAGIYVMGCGNRHFGDMQFYSAGQIGSSTLLGPNAAVQAFETNDAVRTQLQLWGRYRYGNRLLYHLGGDLFFVIPVFLEVETSADRVIEKLGGVGLVDAQTGGRVSLGENVVEAYYEMFGLLNQTVVEAGEVGFESASFSPLTIDSGEFTELSMLLRNNDNMSHDLSVDITVAAGDFEVFWHGSNVTPMVHPTNTTYSLNIGTVGPGDSYGTTPQLRAYLPEGVVLSTYLIIVTLRTEEGIADQIVLTLTVT